LAERCARTVFGEGFWGQRLCPLSRWLSSVKALCKTKVQTSETNCPHVSVVLFDTPVDALLDA
jgi:hypothetical protein